MQKQNYLANDNFSGEQQLGYLQCRFRVQSVPDEVQIKMPHECMREVLIQFTL